LSVPVAHPAGEPAPFALRVPGGCVVLHGGGLTTTEYVGLPPLDACAVDDAYYRAKAAEFGHGGDLDGFVRCHELLHSALFPRWLGLPHSPTLHALARRKATPDAPTYPYYPLWRLEEAAVEAVHRWAKAAGVDLVRLAVEAAERGER
jgi:hypothetical protein